MNSFGRRREARRARIVDGNFRVAVYPTLKDQPDFRWSSCILENDNHAISGADFSTFPAEIELEVVGELMKNREFFE